MPPRTVAEFAAHRLHVSLSCQSCGGVQVVPSDVLDAAFGSDFDLVAGWREVSRQLYCPACGAPRPAVLIEEPAAVTAEAEAEPLRRHG